MYGTSMYPRVGQSGHPAVPPAGRPGSHHQTSSPSISSGLGIRVAIKPEYQISQPPPLTPHVGEIPRCSFHFDFEIEKKILAEAEKGSQNWSKLGLENIPSTASKSASSFGSVTDPVISKYVALGFSQDAVPVAVANYGDNPTKVREFVHGYNLLREMGFSSSSTAEALLMFDCDTDKALAYCLNSSS